MARRRGSRTATAGRVGPWANGVVDVEGHRGAKGLVVEHTLSSFAAAFDAGVTGVELDVQLTADGHVVVWHDAQLLPIKCRSTAQDLVGAKVADLTLAQLRTVDIGSIQLPGYPGQLTAPGARISTLADLLAFGLDRAPEVWWTIELKIDVRDAAQVAGREALLDGVLETVHAAGLERQCFVHSFDWAVLELSAVRAPHVARSALVDRHHTWVPGSPLTGSVDVTAHPDVCAGVAALGAHVVSPEHPMVDRAFVERAHELGLAVLPWTVNEESRARSLVEAGVDGIVTDFPDRVRAVVDELRGAGATG